jgi:predicted ATP-grasp superfamily ATP-dependent carboligase
VYKKYCNLADKLIVQRWIDGTNSNNYTCFCYYDKNSNPVVTFTSRKIRQWPPLTGQRCSGEEYPNEFVEKTTIDLYNSIPFRGLGYLELKKDKKTGNFDIIEANIGRPVGPSNLAERSGVEILYTMYCDCVGLKRPGNLKQQYKGTKWVHLVRDFQAFLYYKKRGQITFSGWLKSLRGKKAYAIFSWTDPLPFLFLLFKIIRLLLFSAKDEKKIFSQAP